MKFTFGIITTPGNENRIIKIINSITKNNIPINDFEIIIVGSINYDKIKNSIEKSLNVKIINFDERVKKAWITKKKNLITINSSFENIVYMHDYFYFDDDWYENMVKFGNDWNVLTNRQINLDGTRFRDWCLWPGPIEGKNPYAETKKKSLLPYNIKHLSKYMYLSGGYWIAKKYVMEEFPLDEKLSWGQGEDVIWSKLVREKYEFKINEKSIVRLGKQKHQHFDLADISYIEKVDKNEK